MDLKTERTKRVHVVNVRSVKDVYFVILSDGSEYEWSHWMGMSSEERGEILR